MLSFDLFCKVVDNLGDAGVTWRLARQLATEHSARVRLWIDQPETLRLICAQAVPDTVHEQVFIGHWDAANTCTDLPQVVISAFGCELPAATRSAVASGAISLWINLEYLSAEPWVDGYHTMASLKPNDGAIEHFYYPGFTEQSGGLIREKGLLAERDAFLAGHQQIPWLRAHGIDARAADCRISLFCYPQAPVGDLLSVLACQPRPVHLLVPAGVAEAAVADFLGHPLQAGCVALRGQLRIERFALLPQTEFDRLLWSCTLNFVRGEDSWLRGLWAGAPFIWQPYRQSENTHQLKLQAFLDRFAELADGEITLVAQMMNAWSQELALDAILPEYLARLGEVHALHLRLASKLAAQTDLASRLHAFCIDKLDSFSTYRG